MGVLHGKDILVPYTCQKLTFVNHALKCTDSLPCVFEEFGQWLVLRSELVLDEYPLSILICDWIMGLAILSNWQKNPMLCYFGMSTFLNKHIHAEVLLEVIIYGEVG